MSLYYVRQVAPHLVFLQPISPPVDPGYGRPGGRPPVDPGWGIPDWSGRPDQSLPGHGHPDQGLPENPNFPDNTLPSHPPPQVQPGQVLVLVRGPDGKWKYASLNPGTVPTPLPEPPTTAQPKMPY